MVKLLPLSTLPTGRQAQAPYRAGPEPSWSRAGGDLARSSIGGAVYLLVSERHYSLKTISC
jgi:hypothetical protein